jgi:hypothetical protein
MTAVDRFLARFRRLTKRSPNSRFLADRRGTTAIEFAMISVPFIGLLGAIFETGTVYFRSAQLQMATEKASRSVLTHSTATGLTYQQFIDQNLCAAGKLSTMFDCSKLLVEISNPAVWSGVGTFAAGDPASIINMPQPGQIAIVRVIYPLNVVMGFLAGSTVGGGFSKIKVGQTTSNGAQAHMIMGVAAFRVEP